MSAGDVRHGHPPRRVAAGDRRRFPGDSGRWRPMAADGGRKRVAPALLVGELPRGTFRDRDVTSLSEPPPHDLAPSTVPPPATGRPGADRLPILLPALFTVVIFLNASLLFVVQPLFSKLALPL